MPASAVIPGAEEREVAAFLAAAATYGREIAGVDVIETHIARVFLAGDEVYKIKKRVSLPFVDFSTLESRRKAVAREIEVNRPHAPGIYLGAVPIVRRNGGLAFGGDGEVIDWAVHMRRFPESAVLVNRTLLGPLPDRLSKSLAAMVTVYHKGSVIAEGSDDEAAISAVIKQLAEAFGTDGAAASVASHFVKQLVPAFARITPLLIERGRAGCIRRCHGDLHLGNIVVLDEQPVPFDALEFSEALATVDVLYDLAFLLMDLDFRGDRHAANIVLNDYVSAAPVGGEIEGLAALPLFLACRAGVRALVATARGRQIAVPSHEQSNAARYVELAGAYLDPAPPVLVAVGGFSGTGKSTLAAELAARIGAAPGALHLRSDVERKHLFGVPETQRLDRQHYRTGVAQRVYSILEGKACRVLRAGHSVIVDAVFAKPEERSAIETVAQQAGSRFIGLWLTAPVEMLLERVEKRHGDASDADRRVVKEQLGYDLGPIAWHAVNASGSLKQTVAGAEMVLANIGLITE
jgi:aminoglycoside phosphotransferase family enzyme/predicted kinase